MAARQLGRRAAAPALLFAGTMLSTSRPIHAEAPQSETYQVLRKPIYDEDVPARNTAPLPSRPEAPTPVADREKGLTTDLARYVRQVRLFAADKAGAAEDGVNAGAARVLKLENDLTATLAGLKPAPETGERVMPGALYVLVAGMAGQIVTRRRNFVLRASVPALAAVAAANYLLPHTSANVAELVWSWEQRFPALADSHLRARAAVESGLRDAGRASVDARRRLDDAVRQGRRTLEDWVQRGD